MTTQDAVVICTLLVASTTVVLGLVWRGYATWRVSYQARSAERLAELKPVPVMCRASPEAERRVEARRLHTALDLGVLSDRDTLPEDDDGPEPGLEDTRELPRVPG